MDRLEDSTLLTAQDIERFRTDPVADLMPLLRQKIFHATSIANYEAIEKSGFIKPNDGSIPCYYERTKTSFGYRHGYISLFDLASTTEEYCAYILETWSSFVYYDYKPITILLGLERSALVSKLIPNNAAADGSFYIPYVEAWYPEPIPLDFIEQHVIVSYSEKKDKIRYAQFDRDHYDDFRTTLDLIKSRLCASGETTSRNRR